MKKAKVFFMTLLIAVTLLGSSGTSLAFDLSKITSKPVQFVKYLAHKIGFGDDEKDKEADPATSLTVEKSEDFPYYFEGSPIPLSFDLYSNHFYSPFISNGFSKDYSSNNFNEGISYYAGSEDWYFRIGTRKGGVFLPFSDDPSYAPVWQTKVEYLTDLPWKSVSQLSTELYLESTFSRQPTFGSNGLRYEDDDETLGLSPDSLEYGLRINAHVKNAEIGFYGWYENNASPLSTASLLDTPGVSSDYLWRALNAGNYRGGNNLAATVSYELPFMGFFHQGMSPTVRLETAYRFGTDGSKNNSLDEAFDQWKVGMAYEGNNRIAWLNSYGINWGVGYNYTVTLDDPDFIDNLRQRYRSHSGNINANTYWFNMKLYTMFMYLYDRETRGSMTVLNATYSPDWRWSYGIKANFYNGKKEGEHKFIDENPEKVTFTATYRWD